MADMEKVISTLEQIKTQTAEIGLDSAVIAHGFIDEIINLLKEQDAVEPYIAGRGESFESAETWWYECGSCNKPIDPNDKYCRHCGKAVKWE